MAVLIILAALVGIIWLAVDRPRVRGRLNGRTVYMRRGPGAGGIVALILMLPYLASRVAQILTVALILSGVMGLLIGGVIVAMRLLRRYQRTDRQQYP